MVFRNILTICVLLLPLLGTGYLPLISPQLQNELAGLSRRGFSYRFVSTDLIELENKFSREVIFKPLSGPTTEEVQTWAGEQGVPILEIDPSLIDTSQYAGWYTFWTEIPLSNTIGNPMVMADMDHDGRSEGYGVYRDFTSPDFEARAYELDSLGIAEFRYNYVPRPGISRLTFDVDADSLDEILFSLSGVISDYEQPTRDSLPTYLQFSHNRYQGEVSGGFTGIYVGYLDQDTLPDLLYKGSEPDSSQVNGVVKIYVTEYTPDSVTFVRKWSTDFGEVWPTGLNGFSVADFDKDGRMEFVVCHLLTGEIIVTENTGDDSFQETWRDTTVFQNQDETVSGDVDGDGMTEFFVGASTSSGNWTLVYESVGDNLYELQFLIHLLSGGVLDFPTYFSTDVDGDGRLDLCIQSGGNIYVIKAERDNDYELAYLGRGAGGQSFQFYDASGDGINDLIVTRSEMDSLGRSRLFADVFRAAGPTRAFLDTNGPSRYRLLQNYPNPFNPSTTVSFSIPRSANVSLKIFNLLGEEVATLVSGPMEAGTHTVQWEATGQPSGVYFYRLETEDHVETRKLVLLR